MNACKRYRMSNAGCITFHGSIGIALFNNALLLWLFHSMILNPLEEDRIKMVELELDPSEILSIPLETQTILDFIMSSVLINFVLSMISYYTAKRYSSRHSSTSLSSIIKRIFINGLLIGTLGGTIVVFLCVYLCGASFTNNVLLTILSSLYISSLTFERVYLSSETIGMKIDDNFYSLTLNEKANTSYQIFLQAIIYCTFFGAMITTILVTLDWGAQVQRWPVPLLLGSTYGNSVGVLFSSMYILYIEKKSINKSKTKTN